VASEKLMKLTGTSEKMPVQHLNKILNAEEGS